MSIQNSINFIASVSRDNNLRCALNRMPPNDFFSHLKLRGFEFTPEEFEESINLLHVKCQFEEQAELLFEVVSWYRIVTSQN